MYLNREWQFHAKSNELTDAFLACPSNSARGPPLLRDERGLSLPGCQILLFGTTTRVAYNCIRVVAPLQQTVDASKFPTLVGQFTQQPSCTILL